MEPGAEHERQRGRGRAFRARRARRPARRRRAPDAQLAVAFNASLPCGGKIVGLTRKGNRVTAVFLLVERPKHRCDAPGQKAAAVFTISKRGLISRWQQIPVPADKRPTA